MDDLPGVLEHFQVEIVVLRAFEAFGESTT